MIDLLRGIRVDRARSDFWYYAKGLKTHDQAAGCIRPYPDFGYLHRYDDEVNAWLRTITLKSRQLYISTYWASKHLHNAWKADGNVGQSYTGIILSKRKDDAIEVRDRADFMLQCHDPELVGWNPVVRKTATELIFQRGGRVKIMPAGKDIGRTFTASAVLLDEFAFHPWAYRAIQAVAAITGTTGRIDIVSTPNGQFNAYADAWRDDNYHKIKVHYSEHPDRGEGSGWKEEARKKYLTDEDWDREQELSFAVSAGRRVYPTFMRHIHIRNFEATGIRPILGRPIYRGWDFGYMHPAVVWWQFSDDYQVRVFAVAMGTEVDLHEFTPFVKDFSAANFGGKAMYVDWVDAAGAQRKDIGSPKGERSCIEVLRGFGIDPQWKARRQKDIHDLVRSLLRPRPNGEPGLIIDEKCGCYTRRYRNDKEEWEPLLENGFLGGYVLQTRHLATGDIVLDEALDDGWYAHAMEALGYSIAGAFDTMGRANQTNPEDTFEREQRRRKPPVGYGRR